MDSDDDSMVYDEDELSDPEDDQEEFDISCDVEAAGEPSAKRYMKDKDDFSYDCLTPESIVVSMKKNIDEVNSVFEIPRSIARILLTHFKWDKEKLLERYYSGDQDRLFKEAHVISPHRNQQSCSRIKNTRSSGRSLMKVDCGICLCTLPNETFTGLECGHYFCHKCWNDYLVAKIRDESNSQNIFCPATECDILVDENFVLKVLLDPTIRSKYHKLIGDSFVQSNRLMKWCPAPDCTNAIKALYNDAKPVTCLCGYTFCFGCTQPVHEPVRCNWLRKWLKKCDDDSETSNWIHANTKECPKCHVTIEKNGGCNHMVCRNTACKADFCWVCLGPWQSHGSSWYNCNRYDEKDAQAARDAQAKSRAALERYLFYCNRYMNHLQSSKFEQKLYNQVKDQMEKMQELNMSWIEVQFLKKAVDVLCMCRNTLKYTYVFAFYLKKNNHSIIFEENQKDLEMATEHLSEYLERDINSDEITAVQAIKQKVQDKYRYCEHRRNVLLDHVYEGYDSEIWEYFEEKI
ncbi:E3 ubiquitin-protein ligase arih1 isoform X1 [Hydra vulgaris]|uniref:RBR-type E3 ubiquitin transferase n=1 Tax=Hydra vulgaris TaxID=6087 RepID=T2M2V0_HYDVU|nr:E3 ubiquitin-protein ligase arih1 [Hydra vulgaris]